MVNFQINPRDYGSGFLLELTNFTNLRCIHGARKVCLF